MSRNQERRRATMIYQDPFSERDLRYTELTLREDFALSERFFTQSVMLSFLFVSELRDSPKRLSPCTLRLAVS